MNYQQLENLNTEYREFMALKKANPPLTDAMVKMNQDLLAHAGKVHEVLKNDPKRLQWFYECTFVGAYYRQWRKNRAISIAHCFEIYKTLNVSFTADDCKGETFYAGIPAIEQSEIDIACKSDMPYSFHAAGQKIGIDGQLHDVDDNGDFRPMLDNDDIYGDKIMVSKKDLDDYLKG